MIELRFEGEIVWWRGPSPFHFVPIPSAQSALIADVASQVTYGWGVIPVTASIGATTFTTSLFPKDGGYWLPVKVDVRRREQLDVGSTVVVEMLINDEVEQR